MLLLRIRSPSKQKIPGSLPTDGYEHRRQTAEDRFPTETACCRSNHYGMASMTTRKPAKRLTEEEIDRVVTTQADNDSAWEKPVRVKKPKMSSLSIPADLAARAAFLARLHRSSGLDEWVAHILRERIQLEEAAFSEAKRGLSRKRASGRSRHRTDKSRR